jgi:hypothetical protein
VRVASINWRGLSSKFLVTVDPVPRRLRKAVRLPATSEDAIGYEGYVYPHLVIQHIGNCELKVLRLPVERRDEFQGLLYRGNGLS